MLLFVPAEPKEKIPRRRLLTHACTHNSPHTHTQAHASIPSRYLTERMKSPFKGGKSPLKSPLKLSSPFKGLLRKRKSGAGSPNKKWMEAAADRFDALDQQYEQQQQQSSSSSPAQLLQQQQDAQTHSPGGQPSGAFSPGFAAADAAEAGKRKQRGGGGLWAAGRGYLLLAVATLAAFGLSYYAATQAEGGRFAALDALMGLMPGSIEQQQQQLEEEIAATTAAASTSSSSSHAEEAARLVASDPLSSSAFACTVPRVPLSSLQQPLGSFATPVVVVFDGPEHAERNAEFAAMTEREALLWEHGELEAKLTSGNSYSQGAGYSTIAEYLLALAEDEEEAAAGGDLAQQLRRSNETSYLFGSHFGKAWEAFLGKYARPPCRTCGDKDGALSFGVGAAGSGVSWHVHGPGYSEVLHGRKRWFLYPPSDEVPPGFHPNMSTLAWQTEVLPGLMREAAADQAATDMLPLVCDIGRGEALYFPHMWWHQILNLDSHTVFVSTFTAE